MRMELMLAENIRKHRRERKLTQEQLAETLGVTAGAVYKWESGLSLPELGLIMELADFFDTSVDALLGYQMKDNRLETALRRMEEYCRAGDREALAEAEKALKKYPNSFRTVHCCAGVYSFFGAGGRGKAELRRALELYEQARLLIGQNEDPEISDFTLCWEMAGVYLQLGEQEKGLELMKRHNAGGIFSDSIGAWLAGMLGRTEEAEPWLAEALLRAAVVLLNAVSGYVILFSSREDYPSARRMLEAGMRFFRSIREERSTDFLVKMDALLHILLAHVLLRQGEAAEARTAAEKAAGLVACFDAAPNYGVELAPFAGHSEGVFVHDCLGATAGESMETMLGELKNEELAALWKEVREHE